MKSSKKYFIFTCILPNYVAHDITKKNKKIAILKLWQLVFFW
jgi:hypothetical protein